MKIKFHLDKQKNPAQHGGVKINYGAGKRIAFRLRWYLILFLIISPVLIFVWYITKDKVIVESPGLLTTEPLKIQASQGRFSLYVLANTFIPPNNHDFASLRRCSFTRNHAK